MSEVFIQIGTNECSVYKNDEKIKSGTYFDCLNHVEKNETSNTPTYYIISNLSTWATCTRIKSELERYDTFEEAMERFKELRPQKYNQEKDDMAKLTLGVSLKGNMRYFPIELDVVHVRNGENYLCTDFETNKYLTSNPQFIRDLNRINKEIGLDKMRVFRKPTEKETKEIIQEKMTQYCYSKKEIETALEKGTYYKSWIPSQICEVVDLKENDIIYFDKMNKKTLTKNEISCLTRLASDIYDKLAVDANDAAKKEYVQKVMDEASEKGFEKTVFKMKDIERSIIKTEKVLANR